MTNQSKLTLGPCLFNWKVKDWVDFYYKIADEGDVDEVYLGEVVCHKRDPFFEPSFLQVAERLQAGGKKVIFSTLSLVVEDNEIKRMQRLIDSAKDMGVLVEINDLAALFYLRNQDHVIGPYVNVYNLSALQSICKHGSSRVCINGEIDKDTIKILAESKTAEIEVGVFGRIGLAIAARCYHARLHGTGKKGCGYVCEQDYDGKVLKTLTGESFLAINGTQTMSHTYNNLMYEIPEMQKMGVTCFRVSPHYIDMVKILSSFRSVINHEADVDKAYEEMKALMPDNEGFSNGFYHKTTGRDQIFSVIDTVE